jgi:GNAT superfamily N-acetyltransferase
MEIALWIVGIAIGTPVLGFLVSEGAWELGLRYNLDGSNRLINALLKPFVVFGVVTFLLPVHVVSEVLMLYHKLTLTKEQYRALYFSYFYSLPLYPDPAAPGLDPQRVSILSRKWLFEYQKYTIYRMDDRPAGERIAEFNDWTILNTFQGEKGWLTREEFLECCRKRIDNGERVYAIAIDGELAAITWVVEQERSYQTEIRRAIPFEPNSAACYGGRVMKKYRKQGLYRDLLRGALIDVWERGIRHVYTSVRYDNKPSQRTQEFVGFKPIATYGYRCVLGKVRKWQTLD